MWPATGCEIGIVPVPATGPLPDFPSYGAFRLFPGPAVDSRSACLRHPPELPATSPSVPGVPPPVTGRKLAAPSP